MKTQLGCSYCQGPKGNEEIMVLAGELTYSQVYVLKNQTHLGQCVLATKGHYEELHELEAEFYRGFMEDVRSCALALNNRFHPDKINYALYGDIVRHVHIHIVPKYTKNSDWGTPFVLNTNSDETGKWKEVIDVLQIGLPFVQKEIQ